MKRNLLALLCALLLPLSACSLAREDTGQVQDRFCGLYVVPVAEDAPPPFTSETLDLTELGTEAVDTGRFGTLSFPKLVLLAREDPETGDYVFPGLPGAGIWEIRTENLTYFGSTLGDPVFQGGGEETTLSGTLYLSEDLASSAYVYLYRVYQTPEGQLYLDGSGDSISGGIGGGYSQSMTATATGADGETVSESFTVSVSFEAIPQLRQVVVRQYDRQDQPVAEAVYTLASGDQILQRAEGAEWVLVTEQAEDGTAKRTVYDWDCAEDQHHTVWFVGENGLGTSLFFTLPGQLAEDI